ncbi:MAG: hypothetical protein HRT87_03105 [Legionellales bacterium]|nr:hypothetical protein [Legionellales bacterium]
MKDIKGIFRNLEKNIKQSSWFDDNWEIYNRGPYLQLYKENWHNDNQGGIHFETYIEDPEIKKKSFPICLHAEEDCPSQQAFIKNLLDIEGEHIRSWKGYQTIGKGYHICQKVLPLNFKNLEQKILQEFNNLRQLESSIDKILDSLSNNEGIY